MFAAGFENELDINLKYYVLKAESTCGGLDPVTADRLLKTTQVESRLEEDGIQWVQVLGGYLSARPLPGGTSILKAWKCTALVSLIEDASGAMEVGAQELDLKWVHAPIEPIANSRKGISALDRESFLKVDEVVSLLKVGERVVVHCQAGCHRTGIFCYVLLRRVGLSPENAMSAIRSTREKTWEEIVAVTKKRPNGLQPKAEGIFGEIFTAMRAVSTPLMPASAPHADLVANAMSQAPAPPAEPTPMKSNEELSAMTKEERTAYHKYRRAAVGKG